MSKEDTKREQYKKCDACDFEKLKRLENHPAIREYRDKIEQLNFKLAQSRSENQMLKRNLHLAKRLMYQEVGGNSFDFQDLMQHGPELGWKDRQETVLVLKEKVQELKKYLKELEGEEIASRDTPSENYVRCKMKDDSKKLWRMELEKRLAREKSEKDVRPLERECNDLRKHLNAEKIRHRELKEETKMLQAEVQSQTEKNKEEASIICSYKTLEDQLQSILTERAQLRQDLNGVRTRNKRLEGELSTLEKELQALQKKADDNNALIDSLTSTHKNSQDAIDAEKAIAQHNADRYREDLKHLKDIHKDESELLNTLQKTMYQRVNNLEELEKELSELQQNETDLSEAKTAAEIVDPAEEKAEECNVPNNELNNDSIKIKRLRIDCLKYQALHQAAMVEEEHLLCILEALDNRMKETASQVLETGKLLTLKTAEKRQLLDRIHSLQLKNKKKGHLKAHSAKKLEELQIRIETRKKENEFLRRFIHSIVDDQGSDTAVYQEWLKSERDILDTFVKNAKSSLSEADKTEQNLMPQDIENE